MDWDIELIGEILVSAFLVIGGLFALVGSFGLVRLRDCMQRLHAPTKATTLGIGGVLIASMIHFGMSGEQISFHELLITVFLFLTAPLTANFIAKAYLVYRVEESDLPPTTGKYGWAIYHDPPKDPADL
ncbi:Na+/H+ antiporter subunit G [Pseudoroseicyclus tamaricis]|uniref:Na+/H+ antiporter subunit G n=1 Tax=Pseudoroseicyclus tamaricis TaxID=2705421 RepID=A0A6B2JZD6_9RHOB|nr:Na+/H+ antiporter subunit G [Pseudoroseicyclus tamaricis]NDV02009.1 Na+/H+ antiporter subunit G [Pseudoroseicyclus tamaricis]